MRLRVADAALGSVISAAMMRCFGLIAVSLSSAVTSLFPSPSLPSLSPPLLCNGIRVRFLHRHQDGGGLRRPLRAGPWLETIANLLDKGADVLPRAVLH